MNPALLALNNGSLSGAPTIQRSLIMTATSQSASFGTISQAGDFAAVVKFKVDTDSSTASALILNANPLITVAAHDGFGIWMDNGTIYANHSDGVTLPTPCSVELDFDDGLWHWCTYIVNKTAGTHKLCIDALTADEQTTTITGVTGATTALSIGGGFEDGTIFEPRIFDALLTEEDHAAYYSDSYSELFENALAVYRCDEISDDTAGDKIWDRKTTLNHLKKGDGTVPLQFPTFNVDHYEFDVNDYVSNVVTLSDDYTVTAVKLDSGDTYPEFISENKPSAFLVAIQTAAGGYVGNMYNLVLHNTTLSPLQLLHAEYQHMYWIDKQWARHYFRNLITDGSCRLNVFFDDTYANYLDYVREITGTNTGITLDGYNGASFASPAGNLEFADDASLRMESGTIFIYGDFDTNRANGGLVDKGSNYTLSLTNNFIYALGTVSAVNHTWNNDTSIAVTWKDGFKAAFYVNGEYIGDSVTAASSDDTDTTVLSIGNFNEKLNATGYKLKHVCICEGALTPLEIHALQRSSMEINTP